MGLVMSSCHWPKIANGRFFPGQPAIFLTKTPVLTSQQQQDRELDELKAELQRRRKYVREAKKMSDIVSGLMAKRGYGQIKSAEKLMAAWKAVAGRMARRSRPGNLRRGVLEITVASSAVMQELVFQKKTLLKKLAAHSGLNIKDLRFRVGSVA